MRRNIVASLVASTFALLAAGCGGDTDKDSGSEGSTTKVGSKGTIKVGLITDRTGPGSLSAGIIPGFEAGAKLIEAAGWKIDLTMVDTQTNPIQARTAAQQLVRKNPDVIIAASGVLGVAAPVFEKAKLPVIGANEDGPEWTTMKNMFSVFGNVRQDEVTTTVSKYLKDQGATSVGSIGYSISQGSAETAQGVGAAAPSVGLKVGYIQSQFPITSSDLGPTALAMKDHDVDGVLSATSIGTTIELNKTLKNIGVTPKAFVAHAGYGSDLLDSGPAAVKGSDGISFSNAFQPVEMNTPATKRFQTALSNVGAKTSPSVATYWGYASALLLKQVLIEGADASPAGILAAIHKTTKFTADGLVGPGRNINPNIRDGQVDGFDNCLFMSKLVGSSFVPVTGALPVCGSLLKGVYTTPTGVVRN